MARKIVLRNYLQSAVKKFHNILDLMRKVQPNPFGESSETKTFTQRYRRTVRIFSGDMSVELTINKDDPFWNRVTVQRFGIFDYVLGIPTYLICSSISVLASLGDGFFQFMMETLFEVLDFENFQFFNRHIPSKWGKWLIRILIAPIQIPLLVAAWITTLALKATCIVVGFVSDLLNAVVQNRVIPLLSNLATLLLTVTGILPLVHMIHVASNYLNRQHTKSGDASKCPSTEHIHSSIPSQPVVAHSNVNVPDNDAIGNTMQQANNATGSDNDVVHRTATPPTRTENPGTAAPVEVQNPETAAPVEVEDHHRSLLFEL